MLTFSNFSKVLNANFRVKVSSDFYSRGILIGSRTLLSIVGLRAFDYLARALECPRDKYSVSFNGLRITFYNK